MATVTRDITDTDITYTITSLYPALAFNFLFTFILYDGFFRYSLDGGSTWVDWNNLTKENLLSVNVDIEQTNIVVQFKTTVEGFYLAINDDLDPLLINDNDNLNIT